MKACLPVAILAAVSSLGCKGNSTCTIGNQSCYQNQAQLCVGPDQGGDADGEFQVIDDCGKQGKVCVEDPLGPFVGEKVLAGCTTKACASTNDTKCTEPGRTLCILDKYINTCTADSNGCQIYVISQDCSTLGKTCVQTGQVAACSQ